MRALVVVLALLLAGCIPGCLSLPDQKLGDGQSGCRSFSAVSIGSTVKGSDIVTRNDNVPKGANETSKMVIKCGDVSMEQEFSVSQPPPPPVNPAIGGPAAGRAGTPPAIDAGK